MKQENIAEFLLSPDTCPVTLAVEKIGGQWKPLIIFMISRGIQRFGAMQRCLPTISKKMLTKELRDLEENGIIHREIFAEIPPRVEYTLTKQGQATLPVFEAMAKWSAEYQQD
ncbi:MAG: helix-turn-helix domain-containing protein [Microscillaceae bacterium]|nr:helix-turn-helix domain-containing protein [Microscillaceae bacterium]